MALLAESGLRECTSGCWSSKLLSMAWFSLRSVLAVAAPSVVCLLALRNGRDGQSTADLWCTAHLLSAGVPDITQDSVFAVCMLAVYDCAFVCSLCLHQAFCTVTETWCAYHCVRVHDATSTPLYISPSG